MPKVMSYARPGSYYNDEKFVRPAHGLVALHGAEIVPVSVLGLARRPADRTATASRAGADIDIAHADAYAPHAGSRRQGARRASPRAAPRS